MKTERLLALTMLLIEEQQISAPKLAEIFEVSVRTIYRDVESLSQAGIPVTAIPGSKGGIRIMDNYKLDQSFFSTADLTSLLIALNGVQSQRISKQARFTIEKLKALIPKEMEKEIQNKANQFVIDLTPWTTGKGPSSFFEDLQTAINRRKKVSFSYEDRSGSQSTRIIEPYRLILKEASWYVQAYCCEKKSYRIFKINRMQHLKVLDQIFVPRKAPEVTFKNKTNRFITIHLEVDSFAKQRLMEHFNDLTFTPIKETECFSVQFPFIPDEFGYHLLLGFGTGCKCIEPEFVKEGVTKRLKQMLNMYED